MEKVQKCEVQEQIYVPSPESFKVYHLSMFHLKTEAESSLRNVIF
jgi:hypothetical protein